MYNATEGDREQQRQRGEDDLSSKNNSWYCGWAFIHTGLRVSGHEQMQMRKTLALCRFWEKHFLSRGMGLGFHCGHIEACLWLILLPCLIRLCGCCFLVSFIFVLKRVDAVKPGGNLRFSPRLSGRWAFPPWAGARTPASADWAGATCPARALLFISRGVVLPLLRSAEHRFPLQIDAWACHRFPLFINFYFLFNQATPCGWNLPIVPMNAQSDKLEVWCLWCIRQSGICAPQLQSWWVFSRCVPGDWATSPLWGKANEMWGRTDEKRTFPPLLTSVLKICVKCLRRYSGWVCTLSSAHPLILDGPMQEMGRLGWPLFHPASLKGPLEVVWFFCFHFASQTGFLCVAL